MYCLLTLHVYMCRGFIFCRTVIAYVISLATTSKLGVTCKALTVQENTEHCKHGGYYFKFVHKKTALQLGISVFILNTITLNQVHC